MVSVYDEDTDKNGFINTQDLRRFYHFDIDAKNKTLLIPRNYFVMSSENEFMYIFGKIDKNENGQMEYKESTDIFWIDLKNSPSKGIQYHQE